MSEHFGFTSDEWELVTELPLEIYLAMLTTELTVDSFDAGEIAFGTLLERMAAQCPSGSWMRTVFDEASRPTTAQAHGATSMSEAELDAHLEELGTLLHRRVGETEAVQFAEMLVKFAEKVAAASPGPFPGSARITKAEGDLIWNMRRALGLMRTLHP
ncbi:MAG: hypothetical protein IPI67_08685 [Myxococcales bacterium]|nr:hypothetical protein [Myxococcales bacterium]